MAEIKQIARQIMVLPLKLYQLTLSPLLGPRCRFYPSCSHYTEQAIKAHGVWRGSYLSVRRLLRCHPLNPGGIDEVPPTESKR
ncbi:MAG: membrane protein insertion efficiency factor YidD [Legionellaceae bacterium]|nr:membrane protein insertion efficiency factor YidD [Legionellaceae bacterium]